MAKKNLPNLPNDIIRLLSYCPLCEFTSQPLQAKLLETKDEAYLVHLQCSHCQSSIIATVTAQSQGLASVGLVTDLTSDEVIRFKEASVITADDVLSIHQLFNKI